MGKHALRYLYYPLHIVYLILYLFELPCVVFCLEHILPCLFTYDTCACYACFLYFISIYASPILTLQVFVSPYLTMVYGHNENLSQFAPITIRPANYSAHFAKESGQCQVTHFDE